MADTLIVSLEGELVVSTCGCGHRLVYTPEGWQHDAAPWFWGDDHDPKPTPEGIDAAAEWARKYDAAWTAYQVAHHIPSD